MDPITVSKLSVIPQTSMLFIMAFADPATRLFAICSTSIPLLISGHNAYTLMGGYIALNGKHMLCPGEVSRALILTSVIGALALKDLPIGFLCLNILQYAYIHHHDI